MVMLHAKLKINTCQALIDQGIIHFGNKKIKIKMADKAIKVAVLEGDVPSLCALGFPLALSL